MCVHYGPFILRTTVKNEYRIDKKRSPCVLAAMFIEAWNIYVANKQCFMFQNISFH